MPSDRQLAANQKNAQKSTGPKTPEGGAAVRLTAATLLLPGEKESDFESLLDSFESEHHPATPTEDIEEKYESVDDAARLAYVVATPAHPALGKIPPASKPAWSAHSTKPYASSSASAPTAHKKWKSRPNPKIEHSPPTIHLAPFAIQSDPPTIHPVPICDPIRAVTVGSGHPTPIPHATVRERPQS